jgi:hypothetical protein
VTTRFFVPLTAAVCLAGTAVILWLLRPVDTRELAYVLVFGAIVSVVSVNNAGPADDQGDSKKPDKPEGDVPHKIGLD